MARRSQKVVVKELRRRASEKRSLRSGDNRGDWLYASAVKYFGSWKAAVEGAGFDYDQIVYRPLTADGVIAEIRALAKAGIPLRASDHRRLANSSRHHFGSWKKAVDAAGCRTYDNRKWTPEKIIEIIRRDRNGGLSLGGGAANKRNPNLYAAARRRFGSWTAAVAAATSGRTKRSRRS